MTPAMRADLDNLYGRLYEGVFYKDHDEDMRLMGVLLKLLQQVRDSSTPIDPFVKYRIVYNWGTSTYELAEVYFNSEDDMPDRYASLTGVGIHEDEERRYDAASDTLETHAELLDRMLTAMQVACSLPVLRFPEDFQP